MTSGKDQSKQPGGRNESNQNESAQDSSSRDDLDQWRQKIDDLDEQLQQLLSKRAEYAQAVAELKQATDNDPCYYRPEREASILRRVIARNQGPLSNESMVNLFRQIISACLALESPLRIAYLGPEGTFTQEAALKQFGQSVTTVPMPSIESIFREVMAGQAHYGVVPIENTTEGVVNHTLDSLIQTSLRICGEVELRVHHHLLSLETDPAKIRKVYAHPHAFAQCRLWLNKHMADAELHSLPSNGEGALRAARENGTAAVAGESAARIYKLNMLASNIENDPENTTRFLILGKTSPQKPSGNDKTSLLLSTHNKPGALYDMLRPLAESSISMSRIESRPSRRGAWDYVFFIDIEGHCSDAEIQPVLQQLQQSCALFKVLGSYPKAVL